MDTHRRSRSSSKLHPPKKCSLLLGLLLAVSLVLVCQAEESREHQDLQLNEQPNRQYFKMHLMSGGKSTGGKKLLPKLKTRQAAHPSAGSHSSLADQAAAGADSEELTKASSKGQHENQAKQKATTTISSATLKKLLNQTLLKSASNNATDSGSLKASKNFKFVFIQRATAAPQPSKVSSPTSTPSPPATSSKEQSSSEQSSSSPKPSLAASVSRQLATSLLNSAADLVANLSSSPSLSSLASQIVAASAAANSISDSPSSRNNSTTPADSSAAASETNRRSQQQATDSNETGSSMSTAAAATAKKATGATTKSKGTKSKQAKIYNLPVKFVANGQPNHVVVFNTLKEHFATIKRLQALGSGSSSSGTGAGGATKSSASRPDKQRKQPSQQQQHKQKQRYKLKGTNSRLIYLPLRYLSNAKANKVMLANGKAAHKAATNSQGWS